MNESKVALRQSHLRQRKKLSEEQVSVLSHEVQRRAMALTAFNTARTVGLYAPLGKEVATDYLCGCACEQGFVVAYPRVVRGSMEFVRFDNECTWQLGVFGIKEPFAGQRQNSSCLVAPDQFDVVVVPGVVFDHSGNRIGYGKGFYDRFLAQCSPHCVFVGLAYDFQLEDNLPREPHDIALHYVVTDAKIVACTALGNA